MREKDVIFAFIFQIYASVFTLKGKILKNTTSRYKMRQNLTKIFDCPEFDNFPLGLPQPKLKRNKDNDFFFLFLKLDPQTKLSNISHEIKIHQ